MSDKGIVEMNNFKIVQCIQSYATLLEHSVNKVHYILLKPLCKMKGLIVVGYGAYGASTNTSTMRWKPYLEDGWGIVFAFIRGGGDVDYEWELDAKTYNKVNSVEDFELVIKDVQKKYTISPNHTCIFGRSAGGYLVGSAIVRNPKGGLFKMAYTEVPYVDVLLTSTNPRLPLTELEYKEFGNPSENIFDFQKILEVSPIDALITPPDINVIIRTSINDTQVYAYESFKWLYKLRGNNKHNSTKLLSLTSNSGHYVIGDTGMKNFSEDFFLLKSFRDNGK
jgi:oligopeptidase B